MKCEVVKDLLPLYAEDLCAAETAKELETHMEQCQECSAKLKQYKRGMQKEQELRTEQNKTDNIAEVDFLKKFRIRNIVRMLSIIVLTILLLAVVGTVGVLSYGQATNRVLSFSAIADAAKIKKVCEDLTEGEVQPLADIVAYRMKEVYAMSDRYSNEAVSAYESTLKEAMVEAYEYYFSGREVEVKVKEIIQLPYDEGHAADVQLNVIVIDFYEQENLIYSMEFGKVSDNTYRVLEYAKGDAPLFTANVLPYDDLVFEILFRYVSHRNYNKILAGEEVENPGNGMGLGISVSGTGEEQEAFAMQVKERIAGLYDAGWYFKDIMYAVEEFDAENGKWVYKLWILFESADTQQECMMEQSFYYYGEKLYVREDGSARMVAGAENVPENIKEKILHLFD